MSTLDNGLTLIRTAAGRVSAANGWMGNAFKSWMPTGLYARALLIMIVPMVVLQSVVAFVFMERHWNTVTRRLSAAVVQDIAGLIDVYKVYPQDKDRAQLRRDLCPVGHGAQNRGLGALEQQRLDLRLPHPGNIGVAHASLAGPRQIFANRRPAHPDRLLNLPVGVAQLMGQSQNFFHTSHV